jgi:MFS transporter, DHA1 family, tetracycline resistance protein
MPENTEKGAPVALLFLHEEEGSLRAMLSPTYNLDTSCMRQLPVLFFTLLLDTISVGILIPVLPAIFTDPTSVTFVLQNYSMGMQYFIAGAITGVFGFMQFLAAPIFGELSDIYGRKRLLMLGVALLALSNIVFGIGITAVSLCVLFISRIVAGLAGGNFSVAQAAIADISAPHERARNFGLISAAFGIGFIIGPLLGGIAATSFSDPAAPFWVAGAVGLLNVVFIYFFFSETHVPEERRMASFSLFKGFENIRDALQDTNAAPAYLVTFFYASGFAFFTTFISILLAGVYDFSVRSIGLFLSVAGVCIVLAQIFVLPFILKRYNERESMLWSFPIAAFCILMYPFVGTASLLYLLVFIMAVPQCIAFASTTALVSKSVSKDAQGVALGINGSVMALSQGIIPLIAGLGTGFIGLEAPFIAGALLVMVSWYILKSAVKA